MTAKARKISRNVNFRLCESTLRHQTRDVYGQVLPAGIWKCTVIHNGKDSLKLDIRTLDDDSDQWSSLQTGIVPVPESGFSGIESEFAVTSESEVKFIISADSAQHDVDYRCEIMQI